MSVFQDITISGPGERSPTGYSQPSQPHATPANATPANGGALDPAMGAGVAFDSVDERYLEGDWHAYQNACRQADRVVTLSTAEKLECKRRYANAYLGARAILHGGVSPKNRPRVLSTDLIASLSRQNATRRYSQYPWLQRLVTLIEEIEQIQETFCDSRNIFHLPPSKIQ